MAPWVCDTRGSDSFPASEERKDPGFEEHREIISDDQNQAAGRGLFARGWIEAQGFEELSWNICQYAGLDMIMPEQNISYQKHRYAMCNIFFSGSQVGHAHGDGVADPEEE